MKIASRPATLYGIGVGPGDPELLTFKAVRIIQETPVIAVPVSRPDKESYALTIVSEFLRPDHVIEKLHFPMVMDLAVREAHRQAAAEVVAQQLEKGQDVAFLTEGDPLLHSTFGYLLQRLPLGTSVEVVPGISSIMAAAAQAKCPLVNADQRLAIIPATFENFGKLRQILLDFDTVVLMKVQPVLDQIIELLDELELQDKAILVERASHAWGRVYHDLHVFSKSTINYLSLVIVHHDARG